MVTKSCLLDRLIAESRAKRELHPHLKRMVLAAAQTALLQVVPDSYHKKCQGAAVAIFMVLRSLRIRASIVGGSVSWLYGTVNANGVATQKRCGFWSHNPDLPTPHAWVVTEFGSLVDLTCSYYHQAFEEKETDLRSRDVLPIIWTKTENLADLPSLKYEPKASFASVDLDQCDELARQLVRVALATFWCQPWLDADVTTDLDVTNAVAQIRLPDLGAEMLENKQSFERLRQSNGWVARNCAAPSAQALTMQPNW